MPARIPLRVYSGYILKSDIGIIVNISIDNKATYITSWFSCMFRETFSVQMKINFPAPI